MKSGPRLGNKKAKKVRGSGILSSGLGFRGSVWRTRVYGWLRLLGF